MTTYDPNNPWAPPGMAVAPAAPASYGAPPGMAVAPAYATGGEAYGNLDEVQERDFDVMPVEQPYLLRPTKIEPKPTRDQTGMYFAVDFEILQDGYGGQYVGRRVWDNFNVKNKNPATVTIAMRAIKQWLAAAGHDSSGMLTFQRIMALEGVPVWGRLKIEPAKGQWDEKNRIGRFITPKPAADAPPAPPAAVVPGPGAVAPTPPTYAPAPASAAAPPAYAAAAPAAPPTIPTPPTATVPPQTTTTPPPAAAEQPTGVHGYPLPGGAPAAPPAMTPPGIPPTAPASETLPHAPPPGQAQPAPPPAAPAVTPDAPAPGSRPPWVTE